LSTDTRRGDGGLPATAMPVRWEVATDAGFRRIVQKGTASAAPEMGYSVHVEVTGLPAHRDFFYRFHTADATSPVGRSRTAPAAQADVDRLRFAFASCQNYEHGYYHAHRDLAQQDVDAVLFLGDYIYEYRSKDRPRVHTLPKLVTVDDYRTCYAQYHSDPDLQAAHAAHPWIVTFDDHEVENNWAGDIDQEDDAPAVFLQKRAAAFQAYYENMPLRRSNLPTGPDMTIYRTLPYGKLAQFTVVDTRQFRTDQPCGDNFKAPCTAQTNPAATMMGATQEAWFGNALANSPAQWNIVANQVMIQQLQERRNGETVFNMDQWDGYPAARKRLTDFLAERKPSNPVVVTGDTHQTWVGNLKADFDDPHSAVVGTELVGTSITSGGDGVAKTQFSDEELANNPHIVYNNDLRGYFLCEIDAREMRSELRTVNHVTTSDGVVTTSARFRTEAGRPGVVTA
ncbi:MAG: alkaline phosphatase D family protein, partial [Janthinobacterium lividum]